MKKKSFFFKFKVLVIYLKFIAFTNVLRYTPYFMKLMSIKFSIYLFVALLNIVILHK